MSKFWKMNGAGNDFVVVDNRDHSLDLSKDQIALLCQRQRGVGADGFLAVEPAENGADFRMRYYNADGGEAEMCGNGARCFARFVNFLEGGNLESTSFETIAGVIGAEFVGDQVRIALSSPFDKVLNLQLDLAGESHTVHSVNTGVPHAVIFVDDLDGVDIKSLGAATRFHEHFAPAGTNANFAAIEGPAAIRIRTYERGVEDETLACGTGMAAAALIYSELNDVDGPIKVRVAGGDVLEIDFDRNSEGYENVTLLGPADFTFEGTLLIPGLS
ncbi:MAG: diaminopimelate epimerase [Verrucomicrobiales bacterium]|nr:diaminopimelate epimerase [Verrucomicrobiales bacterium]